MKKQNKAVLSVISLGLAILPCAARASTITYNVSGAGGDGTLSASAVFTTSAGQLTVVVTNTLPLSSFISVGQTVSDISFNLSNAAGTVGTATASGQEGNISSTGVVTDISGTPGRFIGTGGGAYTVSGNTVTLEAIGGGQPTELIAPAEGNGATYPSTNPGIDAHNPYTIGPGTFVLNLAGVTADTTITGVDFSFGTGPDTVLAAGPTPPPPPAVTPEPESFWLALSGALSIGGVQLTRFLRSAKS